MSSFSCCRTAHSIMLIMPLIGLIWPSNESSPANMRLYRSDCKSCSDSARMFRAIGKSREDPFLERLAGARLMTSLRRGKVKPELRMADFIRSRLSSMMRLGRPMIEKEGRP